MKKFIVRVIYQDNKENEFSFDDLLSAETFNDLISSSGLSNVKTTFIVER